MRKVVIATDSFKGTLTSRQAGQAMADGVRQVWPGAEVVVLPVGDGGEGTAEALVDALGGKWQTAGVTDPLGRPVEARFGLLPDGKAGVLEMAAASGLTLLSPDECDPLRATTFGAGQLMTAALDAGCHRLTIGVGGSATVDGGCGMAQALGVRFLDQDGEPLPAGLGGGDVGRIERIDVSARDPRWADCTCTVLCDVNNPLCGPEGAAAVYGPQKGATPGQVDMLDRNLAHLADCIERELGVKVADVPRCGASGGLAAGLLAIVGAELVAGIEAVLDAVDFNRHLTGVDLVITGEGRLDGQSLMGKVVGGVADRAAAAGVPVIAIAGCAGPDVERCARRLAAYYVVNHAPPETLPQAGEAAAALARRTGEALLDAVDL